MANIIIKHKVAKYSDWKSKFDDFVDIRRSGGEQSYKIMQVDNDPNNLLLSFEWDSIENAKTFLASEELKNAMQEAGVMEPPTIHFVDTVDHGNL
jgi:quinol monooxygenase YgiN